MAARHLASAAPHDGDGPKLPRHLVTVVLAAAVIFLVVGMLQLTNRVTALELRLDSLVATDQVKRAPPPSRERSESEPPVPLDRDGARMPQTSERPVRSQTHDRPAPRSSSSGSSSSSFSGSSDDGREAELTIRGDHDGVIPRQPTPGQERANLQRMNQRFEDHVGGRGYDEETSIALEDEFERSIAAHGDTRERLQSGEMSDRERHEMMQEDLATTVDNVFEILGPEEGLEYIEDVMGVPEEKLRKLNILSDDQEGPPPE